jgi:hypothetical protein
MKSERGETGESNKPDIEVIIQYMLELEVQGIILWDALALG